MLCFFLKLIFCVLHPVLFLYFMIFLYGSLFWLYAYNFLFSCEALYIPNETYFINKLYFVLLINIYFFFKGKFIRINFDVNGYIVGANIETCILFHRNQICISSNNSEQNPRTTLLFFFIHCISRDNGDCTFEENALNH